MLIIEIEKRHNKMVDRIRWDTVSYLPFYYVFFQFLLSTIFNLQANILTTKDILSNLEERYISFPDSPSSKVCPMSFHLERHFCLILNWNLTWNDIFLHIFLVNDSIRLFANSENNETLLYDISHLLLLPAP